MKRVQSSACALLLGLSAACSQGGGSDAPVAIAQEEAQQAFDAKAEYAALESSSSRDGLAWYQLAGNARNAGDTETASAALARAETLEFSPVRIGVERARIAIAAGKPDEAESELQDIADGGFTAVQVLTGDAVINSLAGREKYDALVASMSIAAYPCEHQEGFADFDFWIGDWVVHTADGQLAGHNSITRAERGCVLLENWSSASGGTGMSINYLDKANDEWVQIWNSAGGSQIDIRGGITDEGMLLVGQIHYVANGTTAPFKGLWTLLDDGRVRQYFEQSSDGGETWQPWFEGFYSRSEQAE